MGTIATTERTTPDGLTIRLRSGTTDEVDAILEFTRTAFATSEFMVTEAEEFTVTAAQEKEWIESLTKPASSVLIVAEHAGQIVGMTDFSGYESRRRSHCGVLTISISRDFRGRGVGELLMTALIDWAKKVGTLRRLELSVLEGNNPAIALYRKLGFQEEGRKRESIRFKDGRTADEIFMVRFV